MNFPGHNYLGPGNPIENGEPVDEDDRIARRHDILYYAATSVEDIRAANRSAIVDFTKDFLYTGNYHSAIGSVGLGLKYIGESVFGVQYPGDVESRKRKRSDMSGGHNPVTGLDDDSGASDSKRKRNADETMDISEGAKQQSDSRSLSSNANATGHGINVHHPISNFTTGKIVFIHQRIMITKGYQFKCIQGNAKLGSYTYNFLSTPYAKVPCDVIPWYMTKCEFDKLPNNTSVKVCRTVVSPMGFRTPFTTNSAGINSVNSNLFVLGMGAHGLVNTYHGVNMKYSITAASPCVPTGLTLENEDDWAHWWGSTVPNPVTNNGLFTLDDIPCIVCNQHPLRTYYVQHYLPVAGASPFPELVKKNPYV